VRAFTVIRVGPPNETEPYGIVIVERDGTLIAGRADGPDFSWLHVGADVALGARDDRGVHAIAPAI
jgi:hypothetical protein